MNKKTKGILGILAGVGLLGAGALALVKKPGAEDECDSGEYACEDEETDVEDVADSE